MGKEWVPPGENVGNVSICYFWPARRCRCLHNKNILAMSARLLEKNWHRSEHWFCSVGKIHKEKRKTKAPASTRRRGRAPKPHRLGTMGDFALTFHICIGRSLSVPLQTHCLPALCPGRLTFRNCIVHSLALCLLDGFNQGKTPRAGDQEMGGEWRWGIYTQSWLLASQAWKGSYPSAYSLGSVGQLSPTTYSSL